MPDTASPLQNHLLAAFPVDVQDRLFPRLELVTLPLGSATSEADPAALYVYFPTDAVLSLVTRSGASIEISVVGNEGMVGPSPDGEAAIERQSWAIVQLAGSAFRLKHALLKNEFERNFRMMVLLSTYARYAIVPVARPAMCNQHHSIAQQLCHWLLLSLDRLPGAGLTMTQQLIANILSVDRQRLTEAIAVLQDDGVIGYRRGQIAVLDRARLERMSCECYAAIKDERRLARNHLLPYLPPALSQLLRSESFAG